MTESIPRSVSAQVAYLARLAPDVIGLTMELERPLHYFPGHIEVWSFAASRAMLQPDDAQSARNFRASHS